MNEQTKGFGFDEKETPSVKKGKNYLLVIGIDHYQDAAIPKLSNAVKDIERLEKILVEHYDFQVHRHLPNSLATKKAILDALEALENKLTEQDNLIIFFSGHGYRKSKHGFIVPFDGESKSTTKYITFAELNVRIDELKMRHFLFILDCCYAGSALKKLGDKLVFNKPSRRVLAASQAEETAEDGFFGKNSPFTAALAEILENNSKEALPVKTLFSDLRNLMDARGVRQLPIEGAWRMDSNSDGEFVFERKTVVNPKSNTPKSKIERPSQSNTIQNPIKIDVLYKRVKSIFAALFRALKLLSLIILDRKVIISLLCSILIWFVATWYLEIWIFDKINNPKLNYLNTSKDLINKEDTLANRYLDSTLIRFKNSPQFIDSVLTTKALIDAGEWERANHEIKSIINLF